MTHPAALGCEQARQALSAHLDHEDPGVAPDRLQAHVDTCPGCRDWLAQAGHLTRLVRIQPARVPDLTDAILAAVAADQNAGRAANQAATQVTDSPAPERTGSLRRAIQAAVAAVAAVQLVLAVPPILGSGFDIHTSHELGSLDATVAVGFLLAAFRPRLARAYTPIALVLAVCLATTSGWDIAHHHVTWGHELTGHLATIAEAGLIWALARLTVRRTGAAVEV